MDMRNWLAIIVIITIFVILADGFRRKSRSRNRIRVKLDKSLPSGPDDDYSSELPSGGARVKPRHGQSVAGGDNFYADVHYANRATEENPDDDYEESYGDSEDLQDEDDFRVHAEDDDQYQEDEDVYEDEGFSADAQDDESYDDDYEEDSGEREVQVTRTASPGRIEPSFGAMDDDSVEESFTADIEDAPSRARAVEKPSRQSRRIPIQVFQNELPLDEDEFDDEDEDTEEAGFAEEVIVINVMARPGTFFQGSEMLPVLKRHGMKLGNMSIFHRHAEANGSGPVMFSMANMVKPGTFDMSTMDSVATPGVSLFQQLPSQLNHMKCFDQMLEAANALKSALDGELKDEQRSVLTRQTIEHCRQRIRDFELRQLSRK